MSFLRLTSFLLLVAAVGTGTLSATTWTLDQALTAALKDNPDARLATHRAEVAEAMVAQARAAWSPQFSLQGRYTQTNGPMMAFGSILNQRAFDFGLDFNHPGKIDNLNATATVAYNLYSGGRPTAGLAAAHAGSRAAIEDVRAAHNQLGAAVVQAYLDIRKAREAVRALEAGAGAYTAAVAVARSRYEAGQMLKADLLNLEVQLAQTREQLISARHGAALAERAFNFVLGTENPAAPVELAETDPALAGLSAPDSADASARPELAGLKARLEAAEAMVRVARGGRQPTVNAFASYQYDHGWKLNRHGDSWLAGVSFDLNVFDGGTTSARIRQSTAELAQVKEMLRKATLGIGLEVEQARLAHADTLERLAITNQIIAQAEESAALSRARFDKGLLLTADLIAVESRLIETHMRHAFAVADERTAVATYRRAVGLPLFTNR